MCWAQNSRTEVIKRLQGQVGQDPVMKQPLVAPQNSPGHSTMAPVLGSAWDSRRTLSHTQGHLPIV